MNITILAIDTSCDETSAAVVCGRRVLSHVEYSQIAMHTKWGGVVPSIARRAHEERIDWVIEKTMKNAQLLITNCDAIAVTYGPGLAIALGVGIDKAIELSKKYSIPLIGVNHLEGHLYSSFIQNSKGNPKHQFEFPYLGLLISGAHTELVLFKDNLTYEILGETRDDAAGEALDKAARMLGFGYPGGPVLERLASQVENVDQYKFPRPMIGSHNFDFSFSGLKTSFLYFTQSLSEEDRIAHIAPLASSFQEAVFATIVRKTLKAIAHTGIHRVLVGGGVAVNQRLRYLLRKMIREQDGQVWFPPYKYLNFDNAAMIGLVGAIKAERGLYVSDVSEIDRVARLSLNDVTV
ncbi:MAG: tRNA (adenosine(37)-N6)-threonylcarbamoyltransferase complex transferase subunit TsaD [Candidatus Roizmanbacteria bacterium]|nr:tRNA (adenosine(37)-N6)-threonylcarbamoyltransferase complex transferase subunit TsaD [Candidatus Roizmanbacteria bacterium]